MTKRHAFLFFSAWCSAQVAWPQAGPAVENGGGYVRTWLVCGPFPNYPMGDKTNYQHHAKTCWGYAHDFLQDHGGEAGVTPSEGTAVAFQDQTRVWRRHVSSNDVVDFRALCPPGDDSVVYAWTGIEAPEDFQGVLAVGSDDGVKAWMNGQPVLDHHVGRPLRRDEDIAPVAFKKGTNGILIKVDNESGEFALCLRPGHTRRDVFAVLFSDRLVLRQDDFLLQPDQDRIAFTVLAPTSSYARYEARVEEVLLTDPRGAVRSYGITNRPGDRIDIRLDEVIPGAHRLAVSVTDAEGNRRHLSGAFWRPARSLGEWAGSEPFRAAALAAAGSAIEKWKHACFVRDPQADRIAEEIDARMNLLNEGIHAAPPAAPYDLLMLSAHPEAQVVVEYPFYPHDAAQRAGVTFYWGSIPLSHVSVWSFTNAAAAAEALQPPEYLPLHWLQEEAVLGHRPVRVERRDYAFDVISPGQADSVTQVLLVCTNKNLGVVLDVKDLRCARARAATILPGCPAAVREAVERWAESEGLPLLPAGDWGGRDDVLVAGDPRSARLDAALESLNGLMTTPVEGIYRLQMARGERVFSAWGAPSREVAERVLQMVADGRPVTPEQVNDLRLEIVKALQSAVKAEPSGRWPDLDLFCGDVHTHTFHSDGALSPAGVALQALACGRDFVVITDHNRIDGAQQGRALLSAHGFAFPVVVGEEITTDWAHMNAYPVREFISPELSPYEITKAARRQGAAIQWDHPGFSGSDFEMTHMKTGLQDTGFDAWEHRPRLYTEWRQAGTLPTLVGSSDSHDGSLGAEATLILAPSPEGDDVAEALRRGRSLLVAPGSCGGQLLYGSDRMQARALSALLEGPGLKAAKAGRLQALLKIADLPGLLAASPAGLVE